MLNAIITEITSALQNFKGFVQDINIHNLSPEWVDKGLGYDDIGHWVLESNDDSGVYTIFMRLTKTTIIAPNGATTDELINSLYKDIRAFVSLINPYYEMHDDKIEGINDLIDFLKSNAR